MPALMDFQIPKITHEDVTPTHGAFVIEPLDRGFGHTYGNSLRRVLLSTIEGTAVTSVKIEGVAHEFSSIKGVREDVTDIILNLKGLVARLHGEISDIEARILKEGPGVVTAADIDASSELEILNPELEICHLAEGARLEMMLTIGRGRGYVAADGNKGPETTIGMIPVDSIFSPVRRVSVHVDSARVGQRTDYDKLTLDIYTDGSVTPREAVEQAAEVLIRQLAIFTNIDTSDLTEPGRGLARRRARARDARGPRDGEHPDRGARARRPLVQLPQARRNRDHRRPDLEDRAGARRDPELRQEVDRGGARDARRAQPQAPR